MAAYNIYEAKTAFSSLVDKAEKGEETVIARAGKPVARIVPFARKDASDNEKKLMRPAPGSMGGDFTELLKALDEPWDDDIQRAFGMMD